MRLKFKSITRGLNPLTNPKVEIKNADKAERDAIVDQETQTSQRVKASRREE